MLLRALILTLGLTSVLGCRQTYFGAHDEMNVACLCDDTYCDSLVFDWPPEGDNRFVRVESSKSGSRFKVDEINSFDHADPSTPIDYIVDVQVPSKLHKIIGFGGAVTDAASISILDLPLKLKEKIFDDYFGPNGVDYNIVRLPLGGTDYSWRRYTCDDMPEGHEDLDLRHFRLQPEDIDYKIPMIHRANRMRAERGLDPLKIYLNSWSSPAWMKENSTLIWSYLKGDHTGPYYDVFARYLVRAIEEYEKHNISIWAMSTTNNPSVQPSPLAVYNSLLFTAKQLADFNEFNLVPNLKAADIDPDRMLLTLYEGNFRLHDLYDEELLKRPNLLNYAKGYSKHYYLRSNTSYADLLQLVSMYPENYFHVAAEASIRGLPELGNWTRGEMYASDILETFLAGYSVWIDWNLALDLKGGPIWSDNHVDSPIIVDKANNVYYKNPMYYAMGQFTRFLKPDSIVIRADVYYKKDGEMYLQNLANTSNDEYYLYLIAAELPSIACTEPFCINQNRGKRMAIVALNRAAVSKRAQIRLLQCKPREEEPPLVVDLAPNSITSFAFNC